VVESGVITGVLSNESSNVILSSISDNRAGIPVNSRKKKVGSLGMSLMGGPVKIFMEIFPIKVITVLQEG